MIGLLKRGLLRGKELIFWVLPSAQWIQRKAGNKYANETRGDGSWQLSEQFKPITYLYFLSIRHLSRLGGSQARRTKAVKRGGGGGEGRVRGAVASLLMIYYLFSFSFSSFLFVQQVGKAGTESHPELVEGYDWFNSLYTIRNNIYFPCCRTASLCCCIMHDDDACGAVTKGYGTVWITVVIPY